MSLEEGIRQRKGMAMGKSPEAGGSFGVESLHNINGGPVRHPDAGMNSGTLLPEGSRAVNGHVSRGAGHMPGAKASRPWSALPSGRVWQGRVRRRLV
jgi:hypothetical protein